MALRDNPLRQSCEGRDLLTHNGFQTRNLSPFQNGQCQLVICSGSAQSKDRRRTEGCIPILLTHLASARPTGCDGARPLPLRHQDAILHGTGQRLGYGRSAKSNPGIARGSTGKKWPPDHGGGIGGREPGELSA
jgi:hypothetical protein